MAIVSEVGGMVGKKTMTNLERVEKHADAIKAKFGKDAMIGYAGVGMTQFSIARHYGGCKINGRYFMYDPGDDSLVREDVLRFMVKLEKDEAKANQKT